MAQRKFQVLVTIYPSVMTERKTIQHILEPRQFDNRTECDAYAEDIEINREENCYHVRVKTVITA